MPAPKKIPVYLFLGFLESGKTSVICDFLTSNRFSSRDKNLVILCEEGEEEIPAATLKKSRAQTVVIEDMADFTAEKLAKLNAEKKPTAVIIEYNGLWKASELDALALPAGWFIFQTIGLVDATTFEVYQKNMKDRFVDIYRYADIVIFNRATKATRQQDIRRTVRAVNRRAQIYFESPDPDFVEEEPELPYSLDTDPIVIGLDDYGAWFIDMQDHPKRYEGKRLRLTGYLGKMRHQNRLFSVFGRMGMACCANDMTFLGIRGLGKVYDTIKPNEKIWGEATGLLSVGYAYNGEANDFSLTVEEFKKEDEPADTIVYFN